MAFSTNGTTVSFGGTSLGECRDVSFSTEGSKIDVSNLSDAFKVFEVGQSDIECEIEVNGHPDNGSAVSKGDTGALSVVWNDGTTDTITLAVVVSVETSGSIDEETTSSITFAPTQA